MGAYAVQIDVKTAQLLHSRLFHDLVGAASAVDTGLEFLDGDDGGGDALALIRQSADRLNNRISFFRAAFGQGGGRQGPLGVDDARALSEGWYGDAKPDLDWPPAPSGVASEVAPDAVKVLLILVMIAEECLPRGGRVSVQVQYLPEGVGMAVTAAGAGAKPADGVAASLSGGAAAGELSSRDVTAYFANVLAQGQGGRLEAQASADQVQLAALFPNQG